MRPTGLSLVFASRAAFRFDLVVDDPATELQAVAFSFLSGAESIPRHVAGFRYAGTLVLLDRDAHVPTTVRKLRRSGHNDEALVLDGASRTVGFFHGSDCKGRASPFFPVLKLRTVTPAKVLYVQNGRFS